jgi:hypothetical protein
LPGSRKAVLRPVSLSTCRTRDVRLLLL